MRPYSPGGTLTALAPARVGSIPRTPSVHRLRLGLPGYLIPFAPLAFAPQRQLQTRKPPSPLVFLRVSTHFTATPGVPRPSPALISTTVTSDPLQLSRRISHRSYRATYALFTPSNSGQRSPPTYYRGCWHVVSRGFFLRYRLLLFPQKRSLQPEGRHPPRGVTLSGLPPLEKFPNCCLP